MRRKAQSSTRSTEANHSRVLARTVAGDVRSA
jgi:hypothetical protein